MSKASKSPADALIRLLAPDGYYGYLNITKPASGELNADVVKKSYRKLSLKHHPDKGGDAETFRVLNRAQKVLTNTKLREQYDILGLDLDDEPEEEQGDGDGEDTPTTTQGIVHEIASMALTCVLQMGVRTLMMAFVALVVVRYRWTLLPALAFLAFIAYKIHSTATSTAEVTSPFILGAGLVIMHQSFAKGFWLYWLGESLVIAIFTLNSLGATIQKTPLVFGGIATFAALCALWFRGKFWNYVIVLSLELFLALFIAMAFPVMEMLLEAILNDKLKKVGDKVRAHHKHLEEYYASQR